jgi:hypothetical protein
MSSMSPRCLPLLQNKDIINEVVEASSDMLFPSTLDKSFLALMISPFFNNSMMISFTRRELRPQRRTTLLYR